MECIVKGIQGEESDAEPYANEVVDEADLGYCELFEFKCAGSRVCSAYLVGGPITKVLTKKQKQTLAMAKLEYETAEKKYEDLKESLLGEDED